MYTSFRTDIGLDLLPFVYTFPIIIFNTAHPENDHVIRFLAMVCRHSKSIIKAPPTALDL